MPPEPTPRAAVPLHAYQQRWFLDRSRFKVGMFSRQSGKTWTTTLEVVDDCYAAAVDGRTTRWIILSRGERQAKEAMREGVRLHARAYGMAVHESEYEWRAPSGERYTALEAEVAGSRITALPANPDTARGFSANVFLDEFARHRDSREIWAALFPVVSAGWKLRVTSTPNGKGNKFYELMTDRELNSIWSRHQVDIHQAVAEGLPRDVAALKAGLNDDELWRQEYELEWLDEASSWLSYDLINACEHDDAGDPARYGGGLVYVGNDIARRRHLWVAWVMELVGDVAWTREITALRGQTFKAQDRALDLLVQRYHPRKVAMDQTGMGEKPVEDATDRYGTHVVEGVVFSAGRQLDLATALKTRFEDRTIRIPRGDRALRADLHAVKKMAGPTGHPRLVVDEGGESAGGGHADRFWAAALAAGAAAGGVLPVDFASAGPRESMAALDDYLGEPEYHGGRIRRRASLAEYVRRMGHI